MLPTTRAALLVACFTTVVLPGLASESRGVPAASTLCRCDGDCDGNGSVTVAELVRLVNLALKAVSCDACPGACADDGCVQAPPDPPLVLAVRNAVYGCDHEP